MTEKLNQEQLRALALELPETEQSSHRGRPDLRVRGKIFATLPPDGTVNFKTTPDELDALVKMDDAAFKKVWGARWIGVDLGRVGAEVVEELLRNAWRLAAPRSLARQLED